MRWLLQRAENADDVPKLLTLDDSADEDISTSGGLASLPGGTLSITVRSATEARETLAELQRIQQELLTARARTAAGGIATLGSNVTRRIQRPSCHHRRTGATAGRIARGFRPSSPANRLGHASTAAFDGLDAALLIAESAGNIDDALKLVGSALEAVGNLVSEIDLGDFDFD